MAKKREYVVPKGTFNSIEEMCAAYNINLQTYYMRRKKGMSMIEALETPVREACVYDPWGNKFKNSDEMCKYHGITFATYWSRVSKYGFTQEEALKKSCKKGKEITYNGKTYKTIKEMADDYGIPPSIVYTRTSHGWGLERAMTQPFIKRKRSG